MQKTLAALLVLIICNLHVLGQDFASSIEIDSYFKQNLANLDPIEGFYLWERSIKFYCCKALEDKKVDGVEEIAIVKTVEGKFEIFTISQLLNERGVFFYFEKTANPQIYAFSNFSKKSGDEVTDKKTYCTINSFAQFSINTTSSARWNDFTKSLGTCSCSDAYDDRTIIFTKLYPSEQTVNDAKTPKTLSGTGFALTSNGYIITNNHVIEKGNVIKIKGINGDFAKAYSASVVVADPALDLALLKINDTTFKTLGYIPYVIANNDAEVGDDINVLGYPLRATMGDEIKFTNGIVSSNSGFQGDSKAYQVSAPVQPGNSGGPMFDSKGNIVGIINSKNIIAENASYSIKSSFVLAFLKSTKLPLKLNTLTQLAGKTKGEIVKAIKKYIYIIEVN